MKEGEEVVTCEICGQKMKKSKARSYGQSDPDGSFNLYWICPLTDKPECYVKLLFKLSTRIPMQALENCR